MTVQVNGQELTLTGSVGAYWFEDGFTHAEIVTALASLEGDITVRLNSGGGIAAEGAAIHATLTTYDGNVDMVVEGIAASAASLIAMAGDTITMADGAVLMIHDPQNVTIGDAAAHQKTIDELEAYARAYARIYAKRSGQTIEACREIMKAETWYDGEAAAEAGFADDPGDTRPAKAKASAFDYRVYAKAPKRLAAMAKAKNWSMAEHLANHMAASAATTKEASMPTDKERADALAAELATMKAEKEKIEADKAKIEADFATANAAAAQATADALKADRDRRAAIMALPETKGREALAEHLYGAGQTAEQAKVTLAFAPVASAVEDPTAAYEAQRLASANLNGTKTAPNEAAKAGWSAAVTRYNAGFNK